MEPSHMPPEMALMQLITGKFVSRAITSAANFGVADVIAGGTTQIDAIAAKLGLPSETLYRLLRALSVVNVFAERPGKHFENTPLGEMLRSDVPGSVRPMARWIGCDAGWKGWAGLDHAVRTGKPGFDEVMGAQVFDYFARSPETAAIFHDAMTGFSTMTGNAVAKAYDFRSIKKLVDVGGGHGAMAEAIAAATPGLEALVYDLPDVVKTAPARKGVRFEGGDFLESVPKGADAYIMKFIIHDWDDARCERILASCVAGVNPGGKILVVEQIVSDAPEAALAKLIDLEMLVMTPGGRERTEAEFRVLFARAGLELADVIPTESPVCVLEGIRR